MVITLYYLKDTDSLWMTPNTSRLHQCTVLKTLSQAINEILGPKYLYFQRTTEHVREIVSKFEVKFGIP